MTIGNFDYFSQFKILSILPIANSSYGPDTIYVGSSSGAGLGTFIDDISLVKDTTQPMISLSEFSLGPDTTVCYGAHIGGQPYFLSYLWNTGDTTRFINVTTTGQYWCRVDYGCSTYTDTINVTIKPPPPAFHIPDTALCIGKPYIAHAPKGYAGYAWSTGTGADSTAIYVQGRQWSRITDVCGQSYTDTFRLVNTPATIPGININSIPPIALCKGTPLTFVTNNVGGGYLPTFQWYKNGLLLPGATGSTHTDSALANGDTLIIAMYSNAGCPVTQPTFSNHVGVTVYPNLPTSVAIAATPDTIGGGPVTFTAVPQNGGPNPKYVWFLNGVSIPYDTTGTWAAYNLKDGDFVSVQMESRAICPAPPVTFSKTLGIHGNVVQVKGLSGLRAVKVYPNPVLEYLTIEGGAGLRATLHNSLGQQVMQFSLDADKRVIDVSALPAGAYMLRLTDSNGNRGAVSILKS